MENQLIVEKLEEEGKVGEEETEEEKKMSKGQKKKLREKRKKEQEAVKAKLEQNEAKELENPSVEESKKEGVLKKKGGKGKLNAAALLALKKKEEVEAFERQQEQKKIQFEREQERIRKEQEDKKKKQQEIKQRNYELARAEIKRQKKLGIYLSKKDKEKFENIRKQLEMQQKKQDIEEEEPTEEEIKELMEKEEKKARNQLKLMKDDKIYFERKQGEFRSPVCCILGHVDTGKTTLLDKIRKTNVQESEAGGITQQIGATFFPLQKLVMQVEKCKQFFKTEVPVPGLLIIDTPGHQSFSNLRSRGSSLCDIAILVIDLHHGLQNQTLQSLELLKKRKTPFVIALNKIDRSYGWNPTIDGSSYLSLKNQIQDSINDYEKKVKKVIVELNSKGYNVAMFWDNPDPTEYNSIIPTSGITGEGIPDLLSVIVNYSTNMKNIRERIKVKKDVFNCTVMEVKKSQGYGTTLDCLLVDGRIKKEDQVVLLGFEGPITAKVKAILTPHPMKEMRVKDQYLHHTEIWGANGVKIAGVGLDNAVAGTPLTVVRSEDEAEDAKLLCENQYENVKKKIKLSNLGVGVVASTLGSLQALLEYLSKEKIPVSYVSVGPVSKEDVMKAMKSTLSEIPEKRKKEYGCLLVFDIKVLQDAQKFAEENDIRIFTADIIYHLTDMFTKFVAEVKEENRLKKLKEAIFPCVLKIVKIFRRSDPILLGVDVELGVLKIGTPLTVYQEKGNMVKLGVVDSLELNHKKLKEARKNTGSVAISIKGDLSIQAGKNFDEKDKLASIISRKSIDCLKDYYREAVTKDDWFLIMELKKFFGIS